MSKSSSSAASSGDLYGNAPDKAPLALILIDVINDLDFPEGDELLRHALPMAGRIADLKRRLKSQGMPAIYVNDNFGRWRSDFKTQVDHCLQAGAPGRVIVEQLRPEHDDYFVLKPKHSGFFSTTLELLLDHLQVRTLVLTGVATNICVLFTASDAYLRGYEVCVPADCVAANSLAESESALAHMQAVLRADTRPWEELACDKLLLSARPVRAPHHLVHRNASDNERDG